MTGIAKAWNESRKAWIRIEGSYEVKRAAASIRYRQGKISIFKAVFQPYAGFGSGRVPL
jgi:hypothetical protein